MVAPSTATRPWQLRRWARRILVLWGATLSIWLLLGADMALRARHQDGAARSWMSRLRLTAPAYYPAGHPLRHPETVHRGIPPGHSQRLPWSPAAEGKPLLSDALPIWESGP